MNAATLASFSNIPDSTPATLPNRRRLACKLSMIGPAGAAKPPLVDRLRMAMAAGFDGVDFDEAGDHGIEDALAAVQASGAVVHNAINHAHWLHRLTSPDAAERERGLANLMHCLRLSHALGGDAVLIVVGQGSDGPMAEIEPRCREAIQSLIPLAQSLGQRILIENVWNEMHYVPGGPADQTADALAAFIDSFDSPTVGLYFDVGNHWKYGHPGQWIRTLGPRCMKCDVKGFSRAHDRFTDLGAADDDVPWADVRRALDEIGFAGWITAEVEGGDLPRLTLIRERMQAALGLVAPAASN